jgi:hypothetical protein
MQPNHSNESSHRQKQNRTTEVSEVLVEDLNISGSVARRLAKTGIFTLGQLQTLCVDDLLSIYWIGKGAIREIQGAIIDLGFEPLGVHVPRRTIKRTV